MGGVRQKRPKVKMSGQTVVRQLSGNAQGNTANATTNAAAGMPLVACFAMVVSNPPWQGKARLPNGPVWEGPSKTTVSERFSQAFWVPNVLFIYGTNPGCCGYQGDFWKRFEVQLFRKATPGLLDSCWWNRSIFGCRRRAKAARMAGFLVDNPIYSEKEPLSEIFRQRLGHRTGVPTPARPRFEIDPSQGLRKTLSADRGNQTHAHCLGSEADGWKLNADRARQPNRSLWLRPPAALVS